MKRKQINQLVDMDAGFEVMHHESGHLKSAPKRSTSVWIITTLLELDLARPGFSTSLAKQRFGPKGHLPFPQALLFEVSVPVCAPARWCTRGPKQSDWRSGWST